MLKRFRFTPVARRAGRCLASMALMGLLGGCGGGAGADAPATPVVVSGGVAGNVTTINGITVPPDPGTNSKTSLAGVDANANGVRDEVERDLAALYGKTPALHAATLEFARKLQEPLAQTRLTSAEALASVTNALIAFECFAATVGNRDDALASAQIIAMRSYNTKIRLAEQTRVYDLSGLTELPDVGVASCN